MVSVNLSKKLLKEKVKLFHGILDDLETSLSQSSSYLETLTALGKEKEKEREEAEKRGLNKKI